MTGELTSIGPVTSQPEDRTLKKVQSSGPDREKTHPPAHPERVSAVSESRQSDRPGEAATGPASEAAKATALHELAHKPAEERVEELARKFAEHLDQLHAKGYLRELRLDYEQLEGGDLMVKIMDARTDKVIREIPPEDQIEFAKRMEEVLGLIMDELA